MRRLAAAVLLLWLVACSRQPEPPLIQEEQTAITLSSVRVADPNATPHLLKGWHEVEHNSWRWTAKAFSAGLKVPRPGQPAKLRLELAVPEPVIARLHAVTLSAAVNATELAPETYSKTGQYSYTRDVPAAVLGAGVARIDFALDRALAPNNVDARELGLVVSAVALE